jgi:hypothetical protein
MRTWLAPGRKMILADIPAGVSVINAWNLAVVATIGAYTKEEK